MVIMQDALPGIKRFSKAAGLGETTERYVTGLIVAFIMLWGRWRTDTSALHSHCLPPANS